MRRRRRRRPSRCRRDGSRRRGSLRRRRRGLLRWRRRRAHSDCAGRLVTLVFEEGEYVAQREADQLVADVLNMVPRERRPLRIEAVRVAGKQAEPCLALADIYLGAWQQFACDREPKRLQNRQRDELLFRTLQPKIGTIFWPSKSRRFTSRTPFDGLEPPPAPPPPPLPTGNTP